MLCKRCTKWQAKACWVDVCKCSSWKDGMVFTLLISVCQNAILAFSVLFMQSNSVFCLWETRNCRSKVYFKGILQLKMKIPSLITAILITSMCKPIQPLLQLLNITHPFQYSFKRCKMGIKLIRNPYLLHYLLHFMVKSCVPSTNYH